ncbi:MAG: class I SAM-dependent rRNA methyltransferase [Pseudomonadota bacterium]
MRRPDGHNPEGRYHDDRPAGAALTGARDSANNPANNPTNNPAQRHHDDGQRERGRIDGRDAAGAVVRRGTIRLPPDVATRVRLGHPWIYRETLGARPLRERTGGILELVDSVGNFVGRGLFDEEGSIAIRVFSRDHAEAIAADLVARRIREAAAIRRRFLAPNINAHRVVNAENDGLPGIVVDRYADYLVVQLFTPSVLRLRESLLDALWAEYSPKAIYEQHRFKPVSPDAPRGPAELARGAVAPVELEVSEGALRFWVDVTAPVSTGLFFDLRGGRETIGKLAAGRRALNLFSYTGAISVYAQHGGASQVVAVDAMAKAHARARRNFALNSLGTDSAEFLVGDVFKIVDRFRQRGRRFDLVVLDPPAFGTSGRGRAFAAGQDYRELVEAVFGVLEPGGLLVAISTTHKISAEEFDRALADGAARAHGELRIIERGFLPPDYCVAPGFPEGNYLKFAVAVRS